MGSFWDPFPFGGPYATTADLSGAAIPNPSPIEGRLAYVISTDSYYKLSLSSGATISANALATSLGGSSRWLKLDIADITSTGIGARIANSAPIATGNSGIGFTPSFDTTRESSGVTVTATGFTIVTAGRYLIQAQLQLVAAAGSIQDANAYIIVDNGSGDDYVAEDEFHDVGATITSSVMLLPSTQFVLAAGATVKLECMLNVNPPANPAGTIAVVANKVSPEFMIAKIG